MEFWEPPQNENISKAHSKLSKNHCKNNLFFDQLVYLQCIFTFGKKTEKSTPPPPYQKVHIMNSGLVDFQR